MQGSEADHQLHRGGMWEGQVVYGGERLRDTFSAKEPFILWSLEHMGEVPVDEGEGKRFVAKTDLTVSRFETPGDKFRIGTLSSAIAAMVEKVTEGDLPVEAYWEEVGTSRGLNPATVLTAVRPWADPAHD